jgi:hypothetical protein
MNLFVILSIQPRMIYLIFIFPIFVYGSVNEDMIVPVYVNGGTAQVRLEVTLSDNRIEEDFFVIDTTNQNTTINIDYSDTIEGISFLDGPIVVARVDLPGETKSNTHSIIGLSSTSPFYNVFPTGFMLVPRDHGGLSMILSPEDCDENFCLEDSMFSVRALNSSFRVKTRLISSAYTITNEDRAFTIDTTKEFDGLPSDSIVHLLDLLIPERVDDELPVIFYNCDIVNGGYPSIQFEVGERHVIEGINFVQKGTIVYSPDDYLQQLAPGVCGFTIRKADIEPYFGLNFLSKVGTHIMKRRIGFCDPRTDM